MLRKGILILIVLSVLILAVRRPSITVSVRKGRICSEGSPAASRSDAPFEPANPPVATMRTEEYVITEFPDRVPWGMSDSDAVWMNVRKYRKRFLFDLTESDVESLKAVYSGFDGRIDAATAEYEQALARAMEQSSGSRDWFARSDFARRSFSGKDAIVRISDHAGFEALDRQRGELITRALEEQHAMGLSLEPSQGVICEDDDGNAFRFDFEMYSELGLRFREIEELYAQRDGAVEDYIRTIAVRKK